MAGQAEKEEEKESGVDFLVGMECVPGKHKVVNDVEYECNKKGRWRKFRKKKKLKIRDPAAKRMQEDIARIFPGLSR